MSIIPDGNEEIRGEIPAIVEIIARTAHWVNPETFRCLPVWCPWTARGRPVYDATWTRRYTNTHRTTRQTVEKLEANIQAADALIAALGVSDPKPKNWTVCHIWGYDDAAFTSPGSIVRDPRYYSCIANMVWLPTPLKGFTDALPEIKRMLRTCAFHLYDWACEHDSVKDEAAAIRAGNIPDGYPVSWPTADRAVKPPGMMPFSKQVGQEIDKRKQRFRSCLNNSALTHFPQDEVRKCSPFGR
jgi:hypothetical protein